MMNYRTANSTNSKARKTVEVFRAYDDERCIVREIKQSRQLSMKSVEVALNYARAAAGDDGLVLDHTGPAMTSPDLPADYSEQLNEAIMNAQDGHGWTVCRAGVAPWFGGIAQTYQIITLNNRMCMLFRVGYDPDITIWYVWCDGEAVSSSRSVREALMLAVAALPSPIISGDSE